MEQRSENTLMKLKNQIAKDPKNPNVRYLRPKDAKEYYNIGRTRFMQIAYESGSVIKVGSTVLIERESFENYLESFRVPAGWCLE